MGARFPVSVKGVILDQQRVVLLLNERAEWELPGGRLEPDEEPGECVAREIREELDLPVEVGPLLDAWVYEPVPGRAVLVLAYGCLARNIANVGHSAEHLEARLFGLEELARIPLPAGYARAVRIWAGHQAGS